MLLLMLLLLMMMMLLISCSLFPCRPLFAPSAVRFHLTSFLVPSWLPSASCRMECLPPHSQVRKNQVSACERVRERQRERKDWPRDQSWSSWFCPVLPPSWLPFASSCGMECLPPHSLVKENEDRKKGERKSGCNKGRQRTDRQTEMRMCGWSSASSSSSFPWPASIPRCKEQFNCLLWHCLHAHFVSFITATERWECAVDFLHHHVPWPVVWLTSKTSRTACLRVVILKLIVTSASFCSHRFSFFYLSLFSVLSSFFRFRELGNWARKDDGQLFSL